MIVYIVCTKTDSGLEVWSVFDSMNKATEYARNNLQFMTVEIITSAVH
jgi:hypothetical protein